MAEIRGLIAATLDGYIASPNGVINWLEEFGKLDYGYDAFIAQIDTVVIGRRTYDQVQQLLGWPYVGKRAIIVSHRAVEDPPEGTLVAGSGSSRWRVKSRSCCLALLPRSGPWPSAPTGAWPRLRGGIGTSRNV